MLHRAGADLSMLITETAEGSLSLCRHALVLDPFGRDGLITALQMLWIDPSLARACCAISPAPRRRKLIPRADAEPGKILHETRACEMANLGEVPFGRYYGSINSTPLFVLLAARYFLRTGDQATIRALWPTSEGGAGLDRPLWRPRRRRLCRILPRERERPGQSGLEGQPRFHLSCRWPAGHRADRAVRSAGLCLCRQAGRRDRWRACWASMPAPMQLGRRGGKIAPAFRGGVLVRGAGRLCHRAGRRQKALPGAHLQCRAGAVLRHRLARARRAPGRDA